MREKLDSTLDRWLASKWLLPVLFAGGALTRGIGALVGGVRADDDGTYLWAAKELLAGRGIRFNMFDYGVFTSWLPPGYVIVQATFLSFFNNPRPPERVFFIVFSGIAVMFFFLLAKRLLPLRYALIAALLWIVYPPQWFWGSRADPHTYAYLMAVSCFFLLFLSWERKSMGLAFLTGLLWASLTLMRGEYLLALFIMAGAGFFYGKNWRFGLKPAFFLVVGAGVCFAPWVIRNYRLHHKFILISTNYADNFWFAYNPEYKFTGDQIPFPPPLREKLKAHPSEVARSQILMAEVINNIRKNPDRAVKTVVGNFLQFWRPWISPQVASLMENVVYVTSYVPIFILFLIGIKFIPWKDPHWIVIGGFIVYKVFVHIPFYVIVRFREMMFPCIVLVAMLGLMRLLDKKSKQLD